MTKASFRFLRYFFTRLGREMSTLQAAMNRSMVSKPVFPHDSKWEILMTRERDSPDRSAKSE